MKRLLLLIFILLQNLSFAQTIEKYNKNRLVVKFKSSVVGDYRTPNSEKKFNHQEFDKINEKNRVQSIALSGNKKKKKYIYSKF